MRDAAIATREVIAIALGVGAVLGVIYTLSPLSVLFVTILIGVSRWASGGLSPRERRWFFAFVTVAVVARLALVAGLFLSADTAHPYATFFGDEELFKNRSVWRRNVAMGLPISPADIIYAFDETGQSSYLYILTFVQALVGNAPYGLHVMNAAFYVTGVLVLYRWVRPVFGGLVAMSGLVLLLYLPTLFIWSVSALKEPIYTLIAVGELICAVRIARGPRVGHRVLGLLGVALGAFLLDGLRKGGMLVAIVGSTFGLAAGLVLTRPRLILATLVAGPLVAAVVLGTPAIQERLLKIGRDGARYHAGHVLTPGYSYQVIDGRLYRDVQLIQRIPPRETAAFVVRSAVSYVTEPLPWRTESMMLRAYLPEQLVWWTTIALLPFGLVAALRRDALMTSVLVAHACAVAAMVAMTSGNIGTLIRHRGLVLPYLVWLSALGGVVVLRWVTSVNTVSPEGTTVHGDG